MRRQILQGIHRQPTRATILSGAAVATLFSRLQLQECTSRLHIGLGISIVGRLGQ